MKIVYDFGLSRCPVSNVRKSTQIELLLILFIYRLVIHVCHRMFSIENELFSIPGLFTEALKRIPLHYDRWEKFI